MALTLRDYYPSLSLVLCYLEVILVIMAFKLLLLQFGLSGWGTYPYSLQSKILDYKS